MRRWFYLNLDDGDLERDFYIDILKRCCFWEGIILCLGKGIKDIIIEYRLE